MTDLEPNPGQRELIESTDGLYLVDAGAGTGKTFSVARRYANIVSQDGVTPEDVLLVTFTTNAASEMKDRAARHCSYGMQDLADAPIQTFHSLCHDLLDEYGHDAPTHLGIDDRVTASTRIIEDDLVEDALFEEFIDRFSDRHPGYADFFRALRNPGSLLELLNQLAAKGVFPTREGWYRNGKRHLEGDYEAFKTLFDARNRPRNDGNKQSRLRAGLNSYDSNSCYLPDAPSKTELRGDGKQVPEGVAPQVFEESRADLVAFVHDVYYEYLEFALARNYLNFGFLQLFAFVLLCEDHDVRERVGFEYVMVDEFQDTSEIQFKLGLLLAAEPNLCAVGDWKQSIYSFQYADLENITEFQARLQNYKAALNTDHERIPYPVDPPRVSTIQLTQNYRSTQDVLDFSKRALLTPAATNDAVDTRAVEDRFEPLQSNTDFEESRIEAIQSEDEHEAVLGKIQDITGNPDYAVEGEDGERRVPEYGDIAVLTRTRDFGREFLRTAREYEFPVAYEGGIEVFRTDPAKLLLAWLRILEDDQDRGWAVVLEHAGYTLDEVETVLATQDYPENARAFREELRDLESLGSVARRVFSKYGLDGPTAAVVLETVQSVHDSTTLTRGELIRFIERGIEAGTTREVAAGAGTNSVTVQTIHATKGLEYPIVVLANMNQGRFPPRSGTPAVITYDDPVGLRQRKQYSPDAHDLPHVYDNWRSDVLRECLPRNYAEERRLLYVAITRAESHVVLTAGEDPNTFVDELPVEVESVTPDPDEATARETEQTTLQVNVPSPEGPIGHTPHTLMSDDVFEDVTEGRGTDFGTRVHEFAEAYVLDGDVTPGSRDEETVKGFLDGLDGEQRAEVDAHLPLSVNGDRVTISGTIDLLSVTPDRVRVVDFKTDLGQHALPEYRKQLSVYYHVVADQYPDREVTASILYTDFDQVETIEPLSISVLEAIVENA